MKAGVWRRQSGTPPLAPAQWEPRKWVAAKPHAARGPAIAEIRAVLDFMWWPPKSPQPIWREAAPPGPRLTRTSLALPTPVQAIEVLRNREMT